jgi:hypothetical protein
MSVTLRDLRRDVSDRLGDLVILTATADGSDSTFTDRANLVGENYAGRQLLVAEAGNAENVGLTRYVASFNTSERTVTFDPALPAETQEGDEAELHNARGVGWKVEEKHRAINRALRTSGALVPVVARISTAFDYAVGTIRVPDHLSVVNAVEWEDADGYWRPVRFSGAPAGSGWRMLPGKTVSITGSWDRAMDGRTVRLSGYGEPQELADDAAETAVDAEYLVAQVTVELLKAQLVRNPTPERERMFVDAREEARALRPKAIGRLAANSVRVMA